MLALLVGGCTTPKILPQPARTAPTLEWSAYTTADRTVLPVRRWKAKQPVRAVVAALHGFNDYSQSFAETASHFSAAGIETVAYDQRGFGNAPGRHHWPGTRLLVSDLTDFLPLLRNQYPGLPLYLLGDSMGGAVASIALTSTDDLPVDGVILVTPAIWARETMPWYQRFAIWIGARLVPSTTLSSASFDIAPSDNPEVRRRHLQDPLTIKSTRLDSLEGLSDLMDSALPAVANIRQRTLILYGLRDVMMPRPPMIALHERWPDSGASHFRFALYPEGHHTLLRDLQRRVVQNDVLAWIQHPDAPLPSGFERQRREIIPLLNNAR